jgi:cardiolipin synthase (CMP-forming)
VIPNILSISRALLSVPFAMVMLSPQPDARWWGAGIMLLGALTDKLDGDFARRFRMETEWGRILDPLADKVGAGVAVIVLLILREIPIWFVIAVLARDLLILAGGVVLKARRGVVLPSNDTGKWAMGVLAVALFCLVIGSPAWLSNTLMAASGCMLLVSLVLYTRRFAGLFRAPIVPRHDPVRDPQSEIRNP